MTRLNEERRLRGQAYGKRWNKLTQEDFNVITMLPKIIKETNEIGKFQIGNLDIEIFSLKENQNNLINL